jgi:hypothetical protein
MPTGFMRVEHQWLKHGAAFDASRMIDGTKTVPIIARTRFGPFRFSIRTRPGSPPRLARRLLRQRGAGFFQTLNHG